MSSEFPSSDTIDRWIAGELSAEEAGQLERFYESHPEALEQAGADEGLLLDLDRETDGGEISELIDEVKTRSGTCWPPPSEDSWQEVVTPSDVLGLLGTLGAYEVTRVVACGGMGIVLEGRDPELDRAAALKVMAPELAANATARARFLREARAAAQLEHENILPIYGVHDEGAVPFFAMRFAAGGTLQDMLDRGETIDFGRLKAIARQVASALAAAHAAEIVHRDIKPANILFDAGSERLWVCDFGIAQSAGDPSFTYKGAVSGTPQYMSPEQARGEELDGRSDLFSLGAVLYRIAVGAHAFPGGTTAAVLERLTSTQQMAFRAAKAKLPRWFAVLLRSLLAKEVADRPGSAEEVVRLIKEQRAVSPRAASGRRRIALAAAGACVLGVAAFGLSNWRGSKVPPAPDPAETAPVRPFVPAEPSIRLAETGEKFASLQQALEQAPAGATLLLSGEVADPDAHLPPRRTPIHLRSAPGSSATISSTRKDVHALFIVADSTVRGIRFERRGASAGTLPILGIVDSGSAVVEDCEFVTTSQNPGGTTGPMLGFTNVGSAVVKGCVFRNDGGAGIAVYSSDGHGGDDTLSIEGSLFLSSTAIHRRSRSLEAKNTIAIEGSILLVDQLFGGNHRNPFLPLTLRTRDCVVDATRAFLVLPDVSRGALATNLRWESTNTVWSAGTPVLVAPKSKAGAGFTPTTLASFEEVQNAVRGSRFSSSQRLSVFSRDGIGESSTAEELRAVLLANFESPALDVLVRAGDIND